MSGPTVFDLFDAYSRLLETDRSEALAYAEARKARQEARSPAPPDAPPNLRLYLEDKVNAIINRILLVELAVRAAEENQIDDWSAALQLGLQDIAREVRGLMEQPGKDINR
mgnify:CR=1 FL=1